MRIAVSEKVAIGTIVVAAIFAALSAPAGAQEKVWKHGLINAKSDAGIFLMVSTRDFAKKQGLKIEISQFKDDQLALKALIAGELDSFEGGPQGVFAADSKGGDVKLLGCHWIVVPHGIYANDKIAKVEDLKGKQIAVSAPNSMPDMLARSALAKYGVSDTDVKLAAVGGDNDRYQALIGGVVDAAVVSNEYQPVAPKNIHLVGRRSRRCSEFPARLHGVDREEIGRTRRRCREISCRRNERVAFCTLAQGRDHRSDT